MANPTKVASLNDNAAQAADVGGVAGARLKAFVERIEKLEEEKSAVGSDIKDVYAEAKGTGFDTKTMRKLIRLRKLDEQKRQEEDELLDLYRARLGRERHQLVDPPDARAWALGPGAFAMLVGKPH